VSAVEDALAAAQAGSGGSLLLSGPAGVGRTALAEHARHAATARGFTVLHSRQTPVSTTLVHGVVRDWARPLLRATSGSFSDPGARLREALAAARTGDGRSLDAVDDALRWWLDDLAGNGPVLLVVDDVQWADPESLRLLDLLSPRLEDSSTVLVTTRRRGEPCALPDVLHRLAVRATVLEPMPLTADGVQHLCAAAVPASAGGGVPGPSGAAVHRLTGGLPFLVRELLRAGGDLESGAPAAVVAWVRARVDRLGEPPREVLRAVAVLGEDASFDGIAALCGLTVAQLADPLEVLVDAALVELGMWRVQAAAPAIGDAVLAGMSPSQRSGFHARAARFLTSCGSPSRVVASHLVHTLPGEDLEVVAQLRTAGEDALSAGAPGEAASLLLRAVGEVAPELTEPSLLRLAATAHLRAGLAAPALDLWDTATRRAATPLDRADCLRETGDGLLALGRAAAARSAYAEAARLLAPSGADGDDRLRRLLAVRVRMAAAGTGRPDRELLRGTVAAAARRPPEEDTFADRLGLALAAHEIATQGREARTARSLALRALADGRLLDEEPCELPGVYLATDVLTWCESFAEGLAVLDAALARARAAGSSVGIANAACARGFLLLRQGHPHRAVADLEAALAARPKVTPARLGTALATLTGGYLVLGRTADAQRLLPELRRLEAAAPTEDGVLLALGLLHAVAGDDEAALASYRAASATRPVPPPPALLPWRELSALSLRRTGHSGEARELAGEAVRLARQWGSPRTLAFSLRVLSRLLPSDEALASLREAVRLCEVEESEDHRVRAETDLGAVLMANRHTRDQGRELLERAVAYGRDHDVPAVVRAAATALLRNGVRVPGLGETPLDRLTRGEQRVVELAASGLTNRAIARELFVTVKAVEWHLSNAYKKLAISSRSQLMDVMGGQLDATADWASSSAR
jgi:DNA-binding CsgD family transcriptional regulator/tetratricopeptide (TPR) repeat protein